MHSEKRGGGARPVRVEPGSRLHAMLGRCELDVNGFHLQAVREVEPEPQPMPRGRRRSQLFE